jgi:competence protein ComEC
VALPLLWAGSWLSKVLVVSAHGFAGLPGASLAWPAPPLSLWLRWWAGLAALVLLRGRWRSLALAAPLAAGLHLAMLPHAQPGTLDVTFLAVGHGDAIVLSSEGHHALVDGGGVPEGLDTAKRFVLPFLQTRGIERLELAALSHPHPDHALGLASALRSLPTARLWLPAGAGRGELVDELVDAAGTAPVEYLEAGHPSLPLGAARVEVLGPPRDRVLLESENDRSLVLRVRHGAVTFLLPGDVESAGEEFLEPGVVTVLKAPHHGSRTSSTDAFLERARPRYVVFCVGRYNRFGFPHQEVVDRYQAAGARCYRTDLDGAITFHSDGREVTVETFRPREPEQARPEAAPVRAPEPLPGGRPG